MAINTPYGQPSQQHLAAQQQQQQQYAQQRAHQQASAASAGNTTAAAAAAGAPQSVFHQLPDGNDGLRQAKRRKPTDRTLPSFTSPSLPTSGGPTVDRLEPSTKALQSLSTSYSKLQQIERKLDWNVSRRRIELQEGLGAVKVSSVKRLLRVYLNIELKDQPWQVASSGDSSIAATTTTTDEMKVDGVEGKTNDLTETTATTESGTEDKAGSKNESDKSSLVDFAKGTGIPRFSVKISGSLLDSDGKPASVQGPVTAFATRIVIDTDRDPNLYDRTGAIEWVQPPPIPGTPLPKLPHALAVTIPASTPTKLRISFYLDQRPERFALVPELAALLDLRTSDRIGVLQALWSYIKMHKLQDPDMKHIKADERLKKLFSGQERVPFHHLPEYVNRLLLPHPPTTIG